MFHMIDNRINVGGGTLDEGWSTLDGLFMALLGAIGQWGYNSGNVCLQPLEGTAGESALKEAVKGFILDLPVGVFCQNHGISELYLWCQKEDLNKLVLLSRIGRT
jgi:hypothetical protein